MRVTLDGRLIQDHFPGIGRYTFTLARALPELPEIEALSILRDPAAPNQRFAWDSLAGSKVRVIDRRVGIFSARDQLTFNTQRRRLAADLIHFPYPVRPYAVPAPTVVTIHDTIPLRRPDLLPDHRSRLIFPLLLRLAAAASRIVLTDSRAAAEDLRRLGGELPAKIRVEPPAVIPTAGDLAGRGAGDHLLYVGINKPHKNLPRLIEAYAASRVDMPLILAGPIDPRYPEAAATAERLGLADRVRCLGLVDEALLADLYRRARCLVFPSLEEGFGLPVLEAMAAGVPVIASDIPAI
ncbi:MAG TPA: glycosyltransferase family 1 protein, partial [Dehalococcoidia bacterium]|nr:glycosyltransferase family 1 protein [Dehalococcoidia bacterium]